jgi:fructosamine-3-kinase
VTLDRALADRIEAALGRCPVADQPLSGGCIADIRRVDLDGGETVVVKFGGDLATEAYMLRYLASHSTLPLPAVQHAEDDLLILDFIATAGSLDADAERHAADLLAGLHGITADRFGHERDTLIGPLPQPNPWTATWRAFFRDQRLLYMGGLARDAGRLPRASFARLERFCARIEDWIAEPARASLIHGDLWGGNVLVRDGRIAAFVDPAIYHADPEIELAFTTLFSTFGRAFFDRYAEHRPIAPGFFEDRRDIYNLYPLLVHARLFGGGYGAQADRILTRFVG